MLGAVDGAGQDGVRRPRGRAEPDGGLVLERPRGLPGVRRFSHEAMATVFEVYTTHPDALYASQAAQAAFDLVDRLEREWSRFLPNSDIGRVNALAAGDSTRVSPSTLDCLLMARHVFELTDGAFDISIGTGLGSVELDADLCAVRVARQGVRLDLGGIGKGYAVDLMAEVLEEWGLQQALVHGGFSSMLALEPPPDHDGWPLTMTAPGVPGRIVCRMSARQLALSASGIRKTDHIVDPRTGDPVRDRLAAWVTVPRPPTPAAEEATRQVPPPAAAAIADALTTASMIMAPGEIRALCEQHAGLEAWLLAREAGGTASGVQLLHLGAWSGPAASPRTTAPRDGATAGDE